MSIPRRPENFSRTLKIRFSDASLTDKLTLERARWEKAAAKRYYEVRLVRDALPPGNSSTAILGSINPRRRSDR